MIRQALGWSAALAVTVTAWCGLPWAAGTALVLVAVTAPQRAAIAAAEAGPTEGETP